ncbi:hypothetical protein [Urbanus proteus nucleopolyhedrovirus]|uniref:Uncharacterized protein n=1 Tax=Urbanus proteus nucleopolyhedrovirus TaxID=1675866 RepID=A0A162GU07_9ABAC|nr:hypothetical protein [Urbanus proteus nucleopolyhedrovirus]AKR17309.1 hypothetical protein [Urbanus proteus nucleopolyhedrovirus]
MNGAPNRNNNLYSVQSFYNNDRKTLKETTLHNGNINKTMYEDIMFLRKLVCRELTMTSFSSTSRFDNESGNKENKRQT